MGKLIVFLVAAVIGFTVASDYSSDGQIGAGEYGAAEHGDGLEGISKAQCIQQIEKVAPKPHRAPEICGCMLSEFKARGLEVIDTFSSDYSEMRDITRSCVQVYSG